MITCVAIGLLAGGGAALATWQFNQWRAAAASLDQRPYIQTPHDVVEAMLQAAEAKEGELVYDLSCGDGRIAIAAAEKFDCRSKGFDIEAERIRESRLNAESRSVADRAEFEQKDVFTLDLSEADMVAIYLLPRCLNRLVPQLQELRLGARVVSHDFWIEGVPSDKSLRIKSAEDGREHLIHLWIAPIQTPSP